MSWRRRLSLALVPLLLLVAVHVLAQWRDGWMMVAPWGVCLVALYDPAPELLVLLALAYAQLFIATDTVRLYQHAAGPLMAYTAASIIPTEWLLAAVAVHVVWWRRPERI